VCPAQVCVCVCLAQVCVCALQSHGLLRVNSVTHCCGHTLARSAYVGPAQVRVCALKGHGPLLARFVTHACRDARRDD